MKLPELETAPLLRTDEQPVFGQAQELVRVFQAGFTQLAQEVIKGQMQRATLNVAQGLQDLAVDLDSKREYTTSEVRTALGADFEALPREVKTQLTQKVYDLQSGTFTDTERTDIPSWLVASSIFDTRTKKLLQDSTQEFSSEGWAQEFREKATQDILAHKFRLGEKQLQQFREYVTNRDTENAIRAANAGDYELARSIIDNSSAVDLRVQEQVKAHIDKTEQVAPVYEALRRQDYGSMAVLLGKLNDPAEFTTLEPQERTALSDRLKGEIDHFNTAAERADKDRMKVLEEYGWNVILTKERAGRRPTFADIPAPGTIGADAQREMIAYVKKFNKGEKPSTDWALYARLLDESKTNRKAFDEENILRYRNNLGDTEFKHLLELQHNSKINPDAFDNFQTIDEAINYRLRSTYKLNPTTRSQSDLAKIGHLKSIVQHEMAIEQAMKGGRTLSLDERDSVIDRTLAREVEKKEGWLFDSQTIPTYTAGIPATIAATFRDAVTDLAPQAMASPKGRVKALETQYKDYSYYLPLIDRSWKVQTGSTASADVQVRVWHLLKSRWAEFETSLRQQGKWTNDEALRRSRLVHLAVQKFNAPRVK